MNYALAKERAAAGAAALDERQPGWHRIIDTRHLMMEEGRRLLDDPNDCGCICAQLDAAYLNGNPRAHRRIGDWATALRRIFGVTQKQTIPTAVRLGFSTPVNPSDADPTFDELTRAWRQEVYRRRRADRAREAA